MSRLIWWKIMAKRIITMSTIVNYKGGMYGVIGMKIILLGMYET